MGYSLCYGGYNQRAYEEVSMTIRSAMTGTDGNDADPKVAYGINPVMSGVMMETKPAEETAQTLRKSPGGENGVIQMRRQNEAIERDYKENIHLRKATLCNHRCEECRFCQDCGDEDGGEYVWCRHPRTLSLPDFFNVMEENMVCDLFEPCPEVQSIGLKAGQPKDGGLGDESEVAPTLSHQPSALEPTLAQSQCDLSQMRYIVRRLTPTECERLTGLPDGYTIPTGLRRFFDADGEPSPELVSEFVDIFDRFNAIMSDYTHTKPPKGKSYNQAAAWLKKISDTATCPDGPRYKGCGNGWATNQPRWILTRMLSMEGIEW